MKIKYITILLAYLSFLMLTIPATACDCQGPPPGDCYKCEDGVWVECGITCNPCYECVDCECVWACGNKMCCDGECCVGCCFGECCNTDNMCCNYACCDNACCGGDCCEDPDAECCANECCSNACCNNTCCDAGESCCGLQCCQGECCDSAFCCSKSGRVCCNNKNCYDSSTHQCCDDGTICGINGDCCNGACCSDGWTCCNNMCCPPGQECCDDLTCYDPTTHKCCERGDGSLCDIDEECCDDGTCNELCCWTLVEDGPVHYSGLCNCDMPTRKCTYGYDEYQLHECERSESGYMSCGYFDDVTIGWHWDCTDGDPDLCGILICFAVYVEICNFECTAAIATCGEVCLGLQGAPECIQALIDCQNCLLVEEEVDCGCLDSICSVSEEPEPLTGSDYQCYGEQCE